ncbi:MAG: Dinitrogenase iron-molybdenum cofactor [Methanomassiliicoccales archaeon PtaU1.Bin124]|nr:MAG: Dinitrogenase iron-molybdenum cofactor [Methanomassiliicoccales archaeon PtaU1.Bin124]
MRICVTAEGVDLDALVAEEFGHAPYFVMVEPDTMKFEAFDNVLVDTDIGYGIQTAENIIKLKADVVITGFVGPHGVKKLESRGIKLVVDEEGTVRQAVEAFKRRQARG